jgi:hypothetical protein
MNRIRDVSATLLGNTIGPARPSPFGTSETSSALREHTEANTPPNEEVLNRLSVENGGLLEPEEVDRIAARGRAILAAAEELTSAPQESLDGLSFGDLTPTKSDEETVHVRRLDDD